jgi:hypothetical protein
MGTWDESLQLYVGVDGANFWIYNYIGQDNVDFNT